MEDTILRATGGSLLFSDLDNPNKMAFEGVLTVLDVPSDLPPGGSGGLRVLIPTEVGRAALPSLVGMPINLSASMDDHDTNAVVGVINESWLGDNRTDGGVPLHVRGHIFAKSFPNEAHAIKTQQSALGFSYETAKTSLTASSFRGETVAVAKSLVFTGAAILYKRAAAYHSTSLAASAESDLATVILGAIAELKDFIDKQGDQEHDYIDTRLDEILTYLEQAKVAEQVESIAEAGESDVSAARLTKDQRTNFALPSKEMFPMPDAKHVRLAWDMIDRAKGLSDAERGTARRNVLKRAKELGVDTSDWNKPGEMHAAKEEHSLSEQVTTTTEVTAAQAPETTAPAPAADLTAAIAGLTELVRGLKADVDGLKASKEAEVAAAAAQEPQRRSADAAQLMAKFDDKKDAGVEMFAAIDKKELNTIDSMAEKLKFFQN